MAGNCFDDTNILKHLFDFLTCIDCPIKASKISVRKKDI